MPCNILCICLIRLHLYMGGREVAVRFWDGAVRK
jgi:hypothetical protein